MTELDKALEAVKAAKQDVSQKAHNLEAAEQAVTRTTEAFQKADKELGKARDRLADAMSALHRTNADASTQADDPGQIPARVRPDAVDRQADEDLSDVIDGDVVEDQTNTSEQRSSRSFGSLQDRLQS